MGTSGPQVKVDRGAEEAEMRTWYMTQGQPCVSPELTSMNRSCGAIDFSPF